MRRNFRPGALFVFAFASALVLSSVSMRMPAFAGPVMSADEIAVVDVTSEASPIEVIHAGIVAGLSGNQLFIVYTNRSREMVHRFEVSGTWQSQSGSVRSTFRRVVTMDLGPDERTTATLDLVGTPPAGAQLSIGVTRARSQNLAIWSGAPRSLATLTKWRTLADSQPAPQPAPQPGSMPVPLTALPAQVAAAAATETTSSRSIDAPATVARPSQPHQVLAAPSHVVVAPQPKPGSAPTQSVSVTVSVPPPAIIMPLPVDSLSTQHAGAEDVSGAINVAMALPAGAAANSAAVIPASDSKAPPTQPLLAQTVPPPDEAPVASATADLSQAIAATDSTAATGPAPQMTMSTALPGGMIIAEQPIPAGLAGRIALLAAGTTIHVRLSAAASSTTARNGDVLPFTIEDDVLVKGKVVIAKGAPGYGHLQDVGRSSNWGRTGSLTLVADAAEATDHSLVLLQGRTVVHPRKSGLASIANLTLIAGMLARGREARLEPGTLLEVSTAAATQIVVADTTE